MDAKQYLEQWDAIDAKIMVNRECWNDKRMRFYLGKPFEQKLKNQTNEYNKAKRIIIEQIKAMPDKAHRVILYHVYVKKMTLKTIAENTGKSYKWVLMKHDEALKVFEEKYSPLEYLT